MAPSVRTAEHPANGNKYAQLWVAKITASSRLLRKRRHQQDPIPKFCSNELVLGKLLGTGAFANIYELQNIELKQENDDESSSSSTESLVTLTNNHPQDDDEIHRKNLALSVCDTTYAVKILKPHASVDATIDFMLETKYLAALSTKYPHENIVQLYGHGDGFVILEHVDDTLSERLETWKRENKEPEQHSLLDRLTVALQLSSALTHLHSLQVMFRDLKPNNVGLSGGKVKLLDFGLVKELNFASFRGYCMSDISGGSYKYLAPEVVRRKPYTWSADVYSYSMILWQLLSLEELFPEYTTKRQYVDHVAIHNERPIIKEEWSSALKHLLQQSWAREASQRPTMQHIYGILQKEVDQMKAEE